MRWLALIGGLLKGKDAIMNMIRMLCGVAVIGIATSSATAQQDPIAARKALMKENGDQAKIGAAMAKGEIRSTSRRLTRFLRRFRTRRPRGPLCFKRI